MTTLISPPRWREWDAEGAPLAGGKLYSYEPSTTTPKALYADDGLSVALSNPVVADSAGLFPAMFAAAGLYKLRLEAADGELVWEVDDVDPGLGVNAAALPITAGGTGATSAAGARVNLGAASVGAVTAVAEDLAILQGQVATGLNGDDEFGALAKEDEVTPQLLADDFGAVCLTRGYASIATYSAISAQTPNDDTIPTSGEGTQVLSASFTPKRSDSTIRIRASLVIGAASGSSSAQAVISFFRGTTCIFAAVQQVDTDNAPSIAAVEFETANWGIAAETIAIRIGRGGSNNLNLNGVAGGRRLGGAMVSTLTIEEWINTPVAA